MGKPNLGIFVCILFVSSCSPKIEEEHREECNAENITERDDDINHSDYPDSSVSKYA